MSSILALMEMCRGKIMTRSAYNGTYANMYVLNDELLIDYDDKEFNIDEPLPFLDYKSLYMNDWIYGKLIQ